MKEIFKFHEYYEKIIFESFDSDHRRWLVINEHRIEDLCFYVVGIFIPLNCDIYYDLCDFNYAPLSSFDDSETAYAFVKQMLFTDTKILLDKSSEKCYTK